jgi:hypothetical protein
MTGACNKGVSAAATACGVSSRAVESRRRLPAVIDGRRASPPPNELRRSADARELMYIALAQGGLPGQSACGGLQGHRPIVGMRAPESKTHGALSMRSAWALGVAGACSERTIIS